MEKNQSSNGENWEKMKKEINELMIQGRDYAHQFGSTSSQETREHLAKKILESFHKSLTVMNYSDDQDSPCVQGGGGSPKSDDSDQVPLVIKSAKKSMPRWTEKVTITPGGSVDTALDDGFSWRKYGQKDILGAKYPRGYYRCTYRKSQGCEATKQIQRSDENQMLFEISYRGIHSCSQAANLGSTSTIPVQNLESNQPKNLDIVEESLVNYNHQPPLGHTLQNLESNNNAYMLQLRDPNVDFFGSMSFSSELGTNMNYSFPTSGSTSHSTSNSPSTVPLESPFDSYDHPTHPFGGFGGFYY